MIFISTLITFLLFDDFTTSSISIIYHIHSDIPHDWITSILDNNQTNKIKNKNKKKKKSKKYDPLSFLEFDELTTHQLQSSGIFQNGKSFSQIFIDQYRPSLTNLLPNNNISTSINHSDHPYDNNNNSIYSQHLKWYTSSPIPYILQNELIINQKDDVLSTKLIYNNVLKHFILITIKPCNYNDNNSKYSNIYNHKKWCLNIYERDAKPFLWKYAFNPKYLYHQLHNNKSTYYQQKERKKQKKTADKRKRNQFWNSVLDFDLIGIYNSAKYILINDLKSIGLDFGNGYQSLDDLNDILQEIILKESTQNPSISHSFKNDSKKNDSSVLIEKYNSKKREYYKSYYDVHVDKIKIVYTDWEHTYNSSFDGVVYNKDSLWKWSNDYKYLMINTDVYIDTVNKPGLKQSELHLFKFGIIENTDTTGRSSLNEIYSVISHETTRKHIVNYDINDLYNMYSPITAITFSKCSLFYSIQNDYKILRAIKLNDIFNTFDRNDVHCIEDNPYMDDDMDDNVLNINGDDDTISDNKTYYEYTDSLMELTKDLNLIHCISSSIEDIEIINESTIVITQIIKHDSYYSRYRTSLIHIPSKYQFIDVNNAICEKYNNNIDIDRWFVIDSRALYQSSLHSSKYYYSHNSHDVSPSSSSGSSYNHLGQWFSSYASMSGLQSQKRKTENKQYLDPYIFLSSSQNSGSYVITSTPYFISLDYPFNKYKYDEMVEIINIKSKTIFTQSALNKNGNLLAILDNTDSILVLRKTTKKPVINNKVTKITKQDDIQYLNVEFETEINQLFKDMFAKNSIHFNASFTSLNHTNNTNKDFEQVLQLTWNQVIEQFNNDYIDEYDDDDDDVSWKVAVEFTPTSIMAHLKPIDIICISADEIDENDVIHNDDGNGNDKDGDNDDDDVDDIIYGYVIVLFEQGVISSYIIRGGISNNGYVGSNNYNDDSSSYLPITAIDFWLETCIDWIECIFLLSFGSYFICSCCRRSRVRIGFGRERVVQPLQPVPMAAAAAAVAAAGAGAGANVAAPANNNNNNNNNVNDNNNSRHRGAMGINEPRLQALNNRNNNASNLLSPEMKDNNDENESKNQHEHKQENEQKVNDIHIPAVLPDINDIIDNNLNDNSTSLLRRQTTPNTSDDDDNDNDDNDISHNSNSSEFVQLFPNNNNNNNNDNDNNNNNGSGSGSLNVQVSQQNSSTNSTSGIPSPVSPLSPTTNHENNKLNSQHNDKNN